MTLLRRIPDRWKFDRDGGFNIGRMNEHIAAWADYVGLAGWEIAFSPDRPVGEHKRATCDVDVIHRRAVISIDSNVPASQVDRTIVHELLHALMGDMEDTFNRANAENGQQVQSFLNGDWERAQEWAIERLASVLTGTEREEWLLASQPDTPDAWQSGFPIRDE